MKHTLVLLASAFLLLSTACHNSFQKESTDTTATTIIATTVSGVSVLSEADWVTILGLVDIENEMSADLFRGSYDDHLLDSLLPDGKSRSTISAYLAIDSLHTVLFDAGLGVDKGGRLMESLKNAHVTPAEVTAVCLTHLHADHIGGLLLDGEKAFPNATLYLSQEEYNAWSDRGPLATKNGLWKQVMNAYNGHIITFHDGEKLFNGLVTAELAPGHTPGHTVYHVGTCLVVGDLLHAQDLQLGHPQFCANFDMNPHQAVATRQRLFDALRDNGLYLSGAHCYEHFINLRDRASNL